MTDNDFRFDAVAGLKQPESEKQVKKDIKSFLRNIKIPLIGTLSSRTRAQLKQDIASLNGTVNLTGKVDSKGVASSLQQATAQAQKQANARPVEVGVDFAVKKDKLVNDIKLLAQQNSKLFKDTDMSIKYNNLLDAASMSRNTVELSSLRNQLSAFKSELKVTNNMGLTFGDSLKKSLSKIMGLLGNFNVIMQFNQQLKNAWTEAKTLDDSLVDLQKVTDSIADRDALYKYFDKAMDKAQDLNVEVNSLIYAITEFKKLGWSLSDAELGGEWATILQNVGDVDIDTAIGSIKTAIASFDEIGGYTDAQMDKKLEAYTDLINNMSNRYSIDAQSLSEAIRLSAGTLTEAHTSIEQAATMFSTANKYYNDASYLGNTVKIGSLRVRASEGDDDAISELEEMGEEIDDLTVATSSLREKLLSLTSVDIMIDDQTFKSYYDQLYEISQVIDDLSDTSRANVLETLFGKNRSAAGAALLSGMKESADAYKDAINSAGSATKEYETWMQSADAASQRFANNLTKTYQSIINGNTVRDFANLGSAVLELANSWGLVEGALKGGLTIGVMKSITNLTVTLKNSAVQVSNYGAALEAVNKLGNFAEGTDEYVDKIDKLKTSCSVLTDTQLKQVLAHKNLSDVQLIEILQLDKLEDAQQQARLTQLGLTQATEAQTEASMANLSITNMLRVAWTKFTTFAKANPMAVGITAIVAATYAAMKASEAWTNRLKNQALESSNAYKDTLEEIESINSELQANGQRIDELNAKENLTLVESEELERLKESNRELENTLALKEKIAQQEKASANKDAVKYFEEDTHTWNNKTGKYSSTHIEKATQYLDEIYKKEQLIHEIELEMSRTDPNTERYRELAGDLDIRQKSYDNLLQRVQDYNEVFTNLDDYLFEGQDDELIQQLNMFYKYMNEVLYGTAGTNTNAIRDILAKADFQSTSKQLEELGKSGELSIATLSSRFPELIEYLDKAGISAQELYQYIMALANPDAINYDNVRKQFMSSLGFGDTINSASEAQLWNEISSLGEEELVLEAYLKVRDQYGEHPEGWNAKDWISHIQSELETELVEIDAQLSISETIDQLNTRLKPAFDSLQSAYQDIFDDDGKFQLNSIDILSTCDSIKSKLDELNKIDGITVDYSAFENFVKVLSNTESTENDVETAFDSLATSITQAALSGAEDFDTLKAALEDLGVANSEMVAFDELTSNTKLLEDAIKQAGLTMDEFVISTNDGKLVASEAAMTFLKEKVGAENCAQALALLQLKQVLINQSTITTADDCQNILDLATAANIGIIKLQQLQTLMNMITQRDAAVQSGDSRAVSELNRAINEFSNSVINNLNLEDIDVDFGDIGGGKSGASKAGKDAGDAYINAYENELKKLQTLRDQGKITEKQYLDYLRKLYQKFFKDKKKYAEQYAKYEHEYLQGMKSLYESALSGIISMLDKQASAYGDSKNAAVESLEAQRDAAIEAKEAEKERYEQEIKLIDKQIAAKEKAIQKIQDEIDAMRSANEQKKQAINLQQDEYILQRMLNQRSKRVYKDGQFVFETDTSGIREAKQKVEDDKLEIAISNKEKEIKLIEKEIDLLNEKKDGINENIDLLDEQIDQINEYYSKLISDTEKFWDNLSKGLEEYKTRWEELGEIEEQAKVLETLRALGIETGDILGMSEEAFAKFKDEYIGILADIYSGNDSMLSALSDTTGQSVDQLGSYLNATQGYIDSLSGIGESLNPVSDAISNVDENMGSLSSTASEANTNISETATSVGNIASGVGELKANISEANTLISEEQTAFETLRQTIDNVIEAINQKTQAIQEEQSVTGVATTTEIAYFLLLKEKILEVKESIGEINDTVTTLDRQPIDNLTNAFQSLYDQIVLISATLGAGIEGQGEGTVSSIKSAIESLNEISLEEGIIAQFTSLKTAIDSVTSAISGGSESSGGEGQGGGSAKGNKAGGNGSESKGESGGGNSLTGAIESIGETANKVIGEPKAEGDGTVIGEFGSMKTAVNDVTTAIGGGDSEGGEGSTGESEGNLIESVTDLGTTTEETLGESGGDGVIGKFEELKQPIQEANEHVHGISDGLAAIDGQEVECTIKVNIETTGGLPAGISHATGTALDTMNLNSAEYNAKYTGNAHVEGTALVSGNWAVQSDEQNALVGEEGYEIVVRDGRFFTVGNTGAEMFPIKKGDIVFNHEQSVNLLKNGHISGRGKAYADGTVGGGKFLTSDGIILEPYDPDKDNSYFSKLYKAWNARYGNIDKNVDDIQKTLSHHLAIEHSQKMNEEVNRFVNNSSSIVNNNKNVQPVVHQQFNITMPNVTDSTTATSLMNDLQSIATKKFQMDW